MRRILAQCFKELAQFRRDRLTVALAYVLPTVAVILYGFAIRLEAKNIPLCVQNFDVGQVSREYVSALYANQQFAPVDWQGKDPLTPLDRGIARAVVVIPPEFSRKIKSGISCPIQVLVDATDVNNARVIKNSVIATTQSFTRSRKLNVEKPLIDPEVRIWFNPGRKESLFIAPGSIAVFLWIFPCLLATLAISREKEQGTMLQLYASSITSFELIAGKALAYLLIAITQAVVLITVSVILFDMSAVGNISVFLISLILYLACSVCFGLLGGSRTNSQSAAVQVVATAGFTTSLLLSGFLYPLRNIAFPLSYLSVIIPARYFVESCRNFFVRGADAYSQIYILLALLAAAFVLFTLTHRVLHRMQLSD